MIMHITYSICINYIICVPDVPLFIITHKITYRIPYTMIDSIQINYMIDSIQINYILYDIAYR